MVEGNPRLGACVGGVGKFMCIGLNYSDMQQRQAAIPEHPILFMLLCYCGRDDRVMLPRGSTHTDWEVELGVVIGKPCKYVSVEHLIMSLAILCQMMCLNAIIKHS